MSQFERQGHVVIGLFTSVSKHHTLVAGTLVLLLFPVQLSFAALVDQDLSVRTTIGVIGQNVPEPFQSLNINDSFQGTITALNVDDAVSGYQSGVTLVDFQMTIAGQSFDSATNQALSGATVQGGEVIAFDFVNASTTFGVNEPTMIFDNTGFWRILFPGWSLSSPTNYWYEITGSHASQAVPIPGAVWLLGSGLVGVVGLRRKFRK